MVSFYHIVSWGGASFLSLYCKISDQNKNDVDHVNSLSVSLFIFSKWHFPIFLKKGQYSQATVLQQYGNESITGLWNSKEYFLHLGRTLYADIYFS